MPDKSAEIKASPPHVVFITGGAEVIWAGHSEYALEQFIADMKEMDFAVWITPCVIFVFTGECE